MKVLILGQGGREHALAWRLSEDRLVQEVFVYPGNPGMQVGNKKITLLETASSLPELVEFSKKNEISFVLVGPENLLVEGVTDFFEEHAVPVYGPSKAAAQLEGSKVFSKQFMEKFGIPTARFQTFFDYDDCKIFLEQDPRPFNDDGLVIKLSGLHAGKGVVVTDSIEQTKSAIEDFKHLFSHGIILEEKLRGKEVSVFYSCLENEYQFLGEACDHKRLLTGDLGPNTGGMGAYSPCPWLNNNQRQMIEEKILKPTLEGLAHEGIPFRGTLFLGLMVSEKGIQVLEYNCRFGDPETQTLLPLIEGSFAKLLESVAKRDRDLFGSHLISHSNLKSVHVVKAADGYPIAPRKGDEITVRLRPENGVSLFYAGVKESELGLVTNGGRVLGVTSIAPTFKKAREKSYDALCDVVFTGEQMRVDIAKNAMPKRIVILASGTGTNARHLIEKSKDLPRIEIPCIIVDQPNSTLLSTGSDLGVPVFLIEKTEGMSKLDHEKKVLEMLAEFKCDWILLAGYMRVLSPHFISYFKKPNELHSRIVNIHPSLLPAFPGLHAYEQAYDAGVLESGVTIHFVDCGVDTGPIWKQMKFIRHSSDTLEKFIQRGKELEWQLYPQFLEWAANQ